MVESGSTCQIHMEGFLIKRGHVRHNWKTRWFKLSETSLRYYKNQKYTVPQGRIALSGAVLTKKDALVNDHNDKYREYVFKITTEEGSEYPIQASTSAEFQLWTEMIQGIIDRLDPTNKQPGALPSSPSSLSSVSSMEGIDSRQNAEAILKMGSREGGVIREARMIDGVRYTQGFSGVELQTWMWKNMRLNGSEAESTLSGLLRVGLLECLTPDTPTSPFDDRQYYRLLTDESANNALSPTYSSDFVLPASPTLTKSKDELKKLNKQKNKDASGLPSDLPPGDIVKRGILFKRGHVIPSWKARCFVLQSFPATLSYFDPAKKPAKTINSLSLQGASVFTVGKIAAEVALALRNPPDHLFCVKVASGTLYLIIATSDAERNEWIQAIKPLCRRKRKDD